MDLGLKTLRECRTDGRAKYFRYRQRQLISIYSEQHASLHGKVYFEHKLTVIPVSHTLCKLDAIHGNRNDFISALKTDLGKSAFEAELEVTVTLRNLQVMYEGTDFTTLTERVKKLRTGGKIPTPFGAALIVAHETGERVSVHVYYFDTRMSSDTVVATCFSASGDCCRTAFCCNRRWQCCPRPCEFKGRR